ncbi:MAG: hypothetical protein V4582_25155 [Pseudomonadota bacterium]
MKWRNPKEWYRRLVVCIFFANFVFSLFIGTRPPFPFPVGFIVLIVCGVCLAVGVRVHCRGDYLAWEFGLLSAGVTFICLYAVAEAIAHIRNGGNYYYVRSIAILPLSLALWYGEKIRIWK